MGIVFVAIGLIFAFAWLQWLRYPAVWIIAIACLVSGSFAIFEARAGWCAVRAMGFKTKI